jgi:hypothetical protein
MVILCDYLQHFASQPQSHLPEQSLQQQEALASEHVLPQLLA